MCNKSLNTIYALRKIYINKITLNYFHYFNGTEVTFTINKNGE